MNTYGSAGVWILAVLVLAANLACAEQPTAKQILQNAGRHYDVVWDYTVDAKLTVESPSIHVREMPIKIYFKKPDKLHVESRDGFAVLPRQGVIVGNPLRELMAGSRLSVERSERALGKDCHVIRGTSEREGDAVQSTVWIDKKDWLTRQIHSNPERGPSIKVKLWYSRVAKRYWLPTMTAAQISLPPLPGSDPEGKKRSGQPTTVTITFANYRVNVGLDDEIFQEPEGSK